MDTQEIVKELKAERARLDRAIAALDGANTIPQCGRTRAFQSRRASATEAPFDCCGTEAAFLC